MITKATIATTLRAVLGVKADDVQWALNSVLERDGFEHNDPRMADWTQEDWSLLVEQAVEELRLRRVV